MNNEIESTRAFWNSVAEDWKHQVGDDGDENRIVNSDPVLWEFAGDVNGLRVLDAGCGTGYLSKKLADRGALVTGVDFAERMIAVARAAYPELDFRVGSCTSLADLESAAFDLVVSNYVLMDTPDLEESVDAFHRVLKPGGVAIVIFSHPCFPQGSQRSTDFATGAVSYAWTESYFERRKCVDPPWKHFKSEFIWFHRPLSDYWSAFNAAGFGVHAFHEPRMSEDTKHLVDDDRARQQNATRPYSVAFKLRKP